MLYAGRLTREKGVDLLADAFLAAQARDPRLELVLAGGGPEEDALRARLGGAARFLGWLEGEELARAYADADLFLFCSQTDTFGQVVLEAQASGLPVVAVDAGGPCGADRLRPLGRALPGPDERAGRRRRRPRRPPGLDAAPGRGRPGRGERTHLGGVARRAGRRLAPGTGRPRGAGRGSPRGMKAVGGRAHGRASRTPALGRRRAQAHSSPTPRTAPPPPARLTAAPRRPPPPARSAAPHRRTAASARSPPHPRDRTSAATRRHSRTAPPPAARAPRSPLRVVDVALFYGERSGGIRTYLDAKAAYARRTGAFEHRLVVPGAARAVDGPTCALPSVRVGDRATATAGRSARARSSISCATLAPDVVLLHDPFWAPRRGAVDRRAGGDGPPRLARPRRRRAPRPQPRSTGPRSRAWLRRAYAGADAVMSACDPRARHRPRRDAAAALRPRHARSTPRATSERGDHVLYAGRLSREKGVFELLEAAARSREPWPLWLMGAGARREPSPRASAGSGWPGASGCSPTSATARRSPPPTAPHAAW